jgi:transcription initiation factor TFIID subunit 10
MSTISSAEKVPGAAVQKRVKAHMRSINKFLGALDGYTPTVPEAVSRYHMQKSGIEAHDERMVKLMSLAADHFLARTIHDSRQLSLLRTQINPSSASRSKASKRKREEAAAAQSSRDAEALFHIDDLAKALAEQGVHITRNNSSNKRKTK